MAREQQKIMIISFLLIAFIAYSSFLYFNLPYKSVSVTDAQYRGKLLWQKYNCTACHQVYGLGGYLGPDLTNVYSLRGPNFIEAILQKGTTVMPNFNLKENEISDLKAYLKNMDASGTADPRKFTIHADGTISK